MAHSSFVDRSIHEMLQGKTGNTGNESDEGLHIDTDTCSNVPFRAVTLENPTPRNHTGKANFYSTFCTNLITFIYSFGDISSGIN